jgi:hypothetical protein
MFCLGVNCHILIYNLYALSFITLNASEIVLSNYLLK